MSRKAIDLLLVPRYGTNNFSAPAVQNTVVVFHYYAVQRRHVGNISECASTGIRKKGFLAVCGMWFVRPIGSNFG